MKILSSRIVVDKLPNACWLCAMMVNVGTEEEKRYICPAIDCRKSSLGSDPYSMPFRRHDCPLVLDEKGAENNERTDEAEA